MSIIRPQITHVPMLTEMSIGSAAIQEILRFKILTLQQYYLWDGTYWFVSHADWGKVFKDVLLNMPKYTVEKFDCEDFAFLVASRVSERYLLNACRIAVGQSPLGYHSWNIFYDELGFHYLEPQTGMIYELSNPEGYRAEIVVF